LIDLQKIEELIIKDDQPEFVCTPESGSGVELDQLMKGSRRSRKKTAAAPRSNGKPLSGEIEERLATYFSR
jgi:hypothetical protein